VVRDQLPVFRDQQHLGLDDLACSFSCWKIAYAVAEDSRRLRSRNRW